VHSEDTTTASGGTIVEKLIIIFCPGAVKRDQESPNLVLRMKNSFSSESLVWHLLRVLFDLVLIPIDTCLL
jgi:hypothetical protein